MSDVAGIRVPLRLAVSAMLVIFVVLAVVYSVVTPVFEGYDEHWHFAFVQHLTAGKGLPRQPASLYPHLANQEASQPPLYYLLAGLVTAWVPQENLVAAIHLNPQFAPVPKAYQDNQNRVVHTDAEDFPYTGGVLALHLARLLSVLLGAGTVFCTFLLARRLFPGALLVALGAMLVAALTPGFLFASAVVDNDILVNFLASLALVLLVGIWQEPSRRRGVAWLGVVLGCTALTKLSGLLMWPFAGLVLAGVAWRRRDWRWLVQAGLLAFGLAVAISAWWYVRNWLLYGNVTGLNMMLGLVPSREKGFGLPDVWNELQGLRWSYWAVFGWFNVSVPREWYTVFDAVSLVAAGGLAVRVVRLLRERDWPNLAGLGFVLLWALFSFAGVVGYTLATPAFHGRLLYPAIASISILLIAGLLAWLPRRLHGAALGTVGMGLLAAAICAAFLVIRPAYAKPVLLQPEPAATTPAVATFEDGIALRSLEVDREVAQPGELVWVKACWEGQRTESRDLIVFVQLLASNDLIAGQKDTYHGLGSYPTSLWQAGAAFCDRYPLRLAETVPAPGPTTLAVGLYTADGTRLAVFDTGGRPLGDHVRLRGPDIAFPATGRTLDYDWGHRVRLVDYRVSSTAVKPGELLEIALAWQPAARPGANVSASIQILDDKGRKIGQSDVQLSPATWAPGTSFEDRRTITIASDAAPGVYQLVVVVYDTVTVENLSVYSHGQALPGGGLVRLWSILVPASTEQ